MGNANQRQQAVDAGSAVVLFGCQVATALSKGRRAPDSNEAEGEAPHESGAQVHMIILALDYEGTGNELTCTKDGDNMKILAQACGVQDLVVHYNNDANKGQVTQTIEEVGSRCQEGDFFIFYYSGHGANVKDKDGDEEDGQDEALCLVTPDGQLDWEQFMTDDEFSELVTTHVPDGVNIIALCDCCHSGTIGDFSGEAWDGKRAISMSGCRDTQTSGDTGNGGIYTHAMLMAIEGLQQEEVESYSLGQLYNRTLDKDEEVFNSAQDITMKWTNDLGGSTAMAWPLTPITPYSAPWN